MDGRHWRPSPLWNPFCSRPGLSSPLGGRGRSPLKNFILEKDFPLPYPKGTDYISPALREGAGGGPLPSRQGRDTVSPAGSGPAPQWGASRTDGRGNGDRRWTVATGDHRPQRGSRDLPPPLGEVTRRSRAGRGSCGEVAERRQNSGGQSPEEFSCPARSRAC